MYYSVVLDPIVRFLQNCRKSTSGSKFDVEKLVGSCVSTVSPGLGLSITKRFAELLGESIGVESEVGKGSVFAVRVPLVYSGTETG